MKELEPKQQAALDETMRTFAMQQRVFNWPEDRMDEANRYVGSAMRFAFVEGIAFVATQEPPPTEPPPTEPPRP